MILCRSAPLFLTLTVAEAGFIIGFERIDTFMVAMTDKLTSRFMEGRRVAGRSEAIPWLLLRQAVCFVCLR